MTVSKNTFQESVIELEHYTISTLAFGHAGPTPIIALHGWLDNAASFMPLADQIVNKHFLALDLVGHGFSSHRPAPMPYHIWDNVVDLDNLLNALNVEKVHLIGHSMGASIAMMYAASFPKKVDKLMLIEGLVPLSYSADNTANALAKAMQKGRKMQSRPVREYINQDEAIRARMEGQWPVSKESASLLIQRALKPTDTGFTWRHDPNLLKPSLVRFCPEQIHDFLQSVESDTTVIKADNGAAMLIDGWVDELAYHTLVEISGGHHVHMEPEGVKVISEIINAW